MKNRKVEIYVDLNFLDSYFKKLNSCDTLTEDFEIYFSFFKIIQQPHIRLISLESGKEIKAVDVIRVYQSNFDFNKADPTEFHYTSSTDYSTIENPQSIFFGEVYNESQANLKNRFGFIFSSAEHFSENWSRLLLINKKSTIHVKSGFSWELALEPYSTLCNSLLLIDPFMSGWNKIKVHDNVVDALKSLIANNYEIDTVITILTKEFNDLAKFGYECISNTLRNIAHLSVESFQEGALTTFLKKSDSFGSKKKSYSERKKLMAYYALNNMMHDRYIITNYHLIISTHSLDLVDRDKGEKSIRKNTQLIIQPILQADYFDFYISKLDDYSSILAWKQDDILKEFLSSDTKLDVTNRHFYKPVPSGLKLKKHQHE